MAPFSGVLPFSSLNKVASVGFPTGTCSSFVCVCPSLCAPRPTSHICLALCTHSLDTLSFCYWEIDFFCCCYSVFLPNVLVINTMTISKTAKKNSQHFAVFMYNIPEESK